MRAYIPVAVAALGVVLTLYGFHGQHTGVTFAMREPLLHRAVKRVEAAARRLIGVRPPVVEIMASSGATTTSSATALPWYPAEGEDGVEVRLQKMEANLEHLRDHVTRLHREERDRSRAAHTALMRRLDDLDSSTAQRFDRQHDRLVRAVRWEHRGVVVSFLGALLSVVLR